MPDTPEQIRQALKSAVPWDRAEVVSVTFPATADQAFRIGHGLKTRDVDYQVLRANLPCAVYHDQGTSGDPWTSDYIVLKCDQASVKMTLLLTQSAVPYSPAPVAPTYDASVEWSDVTGAGKPADGATVGADWSTNLTGRPVELTDGRVATALNASGTVVTQVVPAAAVAAAGAGLYLGQDYLGYYNGAVWKSYLDNAGHFYLSGASGNALAWDGSALSIVGSVTVTGGNALTTGGAAADVNGNATTVDGGKITAGTITASHIEVDNLAAINADLGTITAGHISGVEIHAGSGNEVTLNSSGIAFDLDADASAVTLAKAVKWTGSEFEGTPYLGVWETGTGFSDQNRQLVIANTSSGVAASVKLQGDGGSLIVGQPMGEFSPWFSSFPIMSWGNWAHANNLQISGSVGIGQAPTGNPFEITGSMQVNDGNITINGTGQFHYDNTDTSAGTALVHASNGYIYHTNSSERYKQNIQRDWVPPEGLLEAFLSLNPAQWDYRNGWDRGLVSFMSEDLEALPWQDEAGRSPLLNYDRDGLPESNRDYTLIALHHALLQRLERRLTALEQR